MSTKGRAAIFVEPRKPLVVDEVEFPDPGADQVLVKLFSSGICHSQLHTMGRAPRPGRRLPALLGHESTGVVVARGRDVTHLKEGDHVITTWVDRNNQTTPQLLVDHALNEREQYTAMWQGQVVSHSAATWAEYALASERVVLSLPNDMATDVTSIIGCAVMTGAGAIINTLQVRPGQSVALFGAGGIGLCAIAARFSGGRLCNIACILSCISFCFPESAAPSICMNVRFSMSTCQMLPSRTSTKSRT